MLGKPIPKKMRSEMDTDPYYHDCARNCALHDHVCQPDPMTGRLIEWEHAMTYKGSRVNEIWAIVPICWYAHRGGGMVKEINEWLALNRIDNSQILLRFNKTDWLRRKAYLNDKYGVPDFSTGKAPF